MVRVLGCVFVNGCTSLVCAHDVVCVPPGAVPSMFILIGNFCSKPFGQHDDDRDTFVRNLDALGSMIASHPSLAASR